MTRFLLRRFVTTLITLLFVSIIIFIMGRISGDPRTMLLPDDFTQAQWDFLGERLGLYKPMYQQYGIFMRDMFTGSFGQSFMENAPVREVIWARLPATLQLAAAAFVLSLVIGVPLGVFSVVRRGGVLDLRGQGGGPDRAGIPRLLVRHYAHNVICGEVSLGPPFRAGCSGPP